MPLAEETTTGGAAKFVALEPDEFGSATPACALRLSVTPAAAATPTPTNLRLEIDTLISSGKLSSGWRTFRVTNDNYLLGAVSS
jgi:hypothetical protein